MQFSNLEILGERWLKHSKTQVRVSNHSEYNYIRDPAVLTFQIIYFDICTLHRMSKNYLS